ncbi:MAG: hypothetical protein E6J11_05580 [Chloroflexi bacterium]|nr:MAG: hypothetical protein E6J11_05580 [Chloroflexota bacterium]
MRVSRTLWRIQLASIRNAARYDSRMRVAFVFVMLFDVAIGFWSGSQLMIHIAQWQALGPSSVSSGLWSICLLTWSGMSVAALLNFLQQGSGNDASNLLFTLPIAPPTLFRAQFGMFFIGSLWNWIFLEIGVTGIVMVVTLGWLQAITWLALIQLGVACTVYVTMVALMLLVRYILPTGRAKPRLVVSTILTLLVILAIAAALRPQWFAFMLNATAPIAGITTGIQTVIQLLLKPAFASILFALLLLMALGPLARWTGNLYVASFLVTQRWDKSRNAIHLPGVGLLRRLLARQRTLTAALLTKDMLSQSRNFFFWGRLATIAVALLFFQLFRSILTTHGFSDAVFVVGYASFLALITSLEPAPNAVSSEGNRLTLYLCTAIAVPLAIIPCIALPVLGSTWELNLDLAVEGTVQALLQEEAAITPKRILLLNLTLVLFALLFLIVWKLPPMLAIAALLFLDIAILALLFQWSRIYLRQLMRGE